MDLSKPGFLGRAALTRQHAEEGAAPRFRTVCVRVPGLTAEAGPYLIHNEPIWKQGEIVGHVTSGDWGMRLQAMVGLASLHRDQGVSTAWIDEGGFTVQIATEMFPLQVQLAPFYDPKGKRMRAWTGA